jgi:hypothetical protein
MQRILVALLSILILAACGTQVQQTVLDRQEALGPAPAKSNYAEAKQIQDIEQWKDDPGKIVFLYINFPPGSDTILTLQCRGVPASSTESTEPNEGRPYTGFSEYGWRVPIDGVDTITTEMAGRDGTYGDPVAFRQCLTVDGTYVDVPALGVPYMVSSVPYTFPPATVKRDFESEARLLKAEEIIRRGGCVNAETLVEEPCK